MAVSRQVEIKASEGGKLCRRCGDTKPVADFGRNRRRADGLAQYCLDCFRAINRTSYQSRQAAAGKAVSPTRTAPAGTRWCPDCNEFRAEETFVRHRGTSSGYGAYCKVHHNVRVQASRLRNGGSRKYHLVRRYGVSEADMLDMIRRQAGLCPICRRSLGDKPHVDHDHATGEVRGLLCFTCNVGLGNYSDDVERLVRAAAYLRGDLTAPSLVAPGVYEVDGHGWRRDEAVGSAG